MADKVSALRKACEHHVKLTRECSQGLGDRHLYAIYCLVQRQLQNKLEGEPNGITSFSHPRSQSPSHKVDKMPAIFSDPGYALLDMPILSTSNCSNPALRLFGFGPEVAGGYGIGYIIKEDGISMCAA
jgi:carnitine O-acetyltransferase